MKLKTLKVGPHEFEVTADVDRHNAACREAQSDLLGRTNFKTLVITLEPTQAPSQMADTLLHETLHCVTDQTGLSAEWGTAKDEAIVARITPLLLAVLRDNPQLVAEIVG